MNSFDDIWKVQARVKQSDEPQQIDHVYKRKSDCKAYCLGAPGRWECEDACRQQARGFNAIAAHGDVHRKALRADDCPIGGSARSEQINDCDYASGEEPGIRLDYAEPDSRRYTEKEVQHAEDGCEEQQKAQGLLICVEKILEGMA